MDNQKFIKKASKAIAEYCTDDWVKFDPGCNILFTDKDVDKVLAYQTEDGNFGLFRCDRFIDGYFKIYYYDKTDRIDMHEILDD